jgi:hypothetical protein
MMRRRFGGFVSGCFVVVARGKRGAGNSKSAAKRYSSRDADLHEHGRSSVHSSINITYNLLQKYTMLNVKKVRV